MNIVNLPKKIAAIPNYSIEDLILRERISHNAPTAFIGSIGDLKGLFLICYDLIVKADQPDKTWSNPSIMVFVESFVDVEIKVCV